MSRFLPEPRFAGALALASAFALGAALGLAAAPGLAAQSLLSSAGGLGAPTDASDARSRMLGGIGVALSGGYLLATDPAASAWIALPGISASMETSVERPEGGQTSGRTRFPAIGVVYPYGGQTFSFTFVGVLGQEWNAEVERIIDLGESEIGAIDRYQSRGGISAARVGWARRFGERVAVGASAGSHVGSLERTFTRSLNPDDVGPEVETYGDRGTWRTTGPTAVAGASVDVTPLIRLGGSVTWSGDMRLDPTDGTTGGTRDVPLPLEVRVGTFATLTPGVGFAASAYRADWSEAAAALGDDAAPGVVWNWGAGVEWSGGTVRDRRIPLALGYRQRDLPFSFLGEAAKERTLSGGVGLHFLDAEETPIARMHIALERGSRSAGEFDETFWRTTVTLRLSGR